MIEWIYAWTSDTWSALSENYHPIWDTLDILVVACVVYWLLLLIRGTRAAPMTLGLGVLFLAWLLSGQLELATLGFLLDNFLAPGVLIVIIIFQADIRRALARVGRGLVQTAAPQEAHAIEEIVRACQALAQRRVGSLIVVEREIPLEEYLELGTGLDSELTRDLLIAIFLPYSPLHDGAVVVREGRIAAAGCILPLALRANLPSELGTRHRAAYGIVDETDAIALVVSEETGKISLVAAGKMDEDLDGPHLRESLLRLTGMIVREGAPEADAVQKRAQVPIESS